MNFMGGKKKLLALYKKYWKKILTKMKIILVNIIVMIKELIKFPFNLTHHAELK